MAETRALRQGSRAVWKFELRPWSMFVNVPQGAEILSAGVQGDDIVVWALCDPEAPQPMRVLAAHPTGLPLPPELDGARFVSTVQMADGLVFHVFDGGERDDKLRAKEREGR